ncbi:hypothetical protein HX109_04185 [Galbibacter sp. BG1]|uniref:hypothetical protein n=1 Tax=Galbibacter sp. BG1 TaxID=1170699 RepID=UPI0015BBF061|nr:hypothetical protein [Galbibacter sp. BG1]QLE00800.1 hypothetical protein HX109_04185 [Galbibacter sp. BG1]
MTLTSKNKKGIDFPVLASGIWLPVPSKKYHLGSATIILGSLTNHLASTAKRLGKTTMFLASAPKSLG